MRYNVTIARKAVQPRSSGTAQQIWNRKMAGSQGLIQKALPLLGTLCMQSNG